jgi:hypothetical protein
LAGYLTHTFQKLKNMNRLNVIQKIIDKVQAKTYVEIGVSLGNVFLNIEAPKKIGIDPGYIFSKTKNLRLKLGLDKEKMFRMPSDDFFQMNAPETLKEGVDVVFVDGMHTYEHSLRDVENSLKYLNVGGVIVMHDCNPLNYASAYPIKASTDEMIPLINNLEMPGYNTTWAGDVWKAVAHLRIVRNDLNIFTLDLDWGMGIITKGQHKPLENYSIRDIENMDYYAFEKDRENILNLKHPKYLLDFLNTLSPTKQLSKAL